MESRSTFSDDNSLQFDRLLSSDSDCRYSWMSGPRLSLDSEFDRPPSAISPVLSTTAYSCATDDTYGRSLPRIDSQASSLSSCSFGSRPILPRNWSMASNLSACVGAEYSSMMAAWVDGDNCPALEGELLPLCGNDFRSVALQPRSPLLAPPRRALSPCHGCSDEEECEASGHSTDMVHSSSSSDVANEAGPDSPQRRRPDHCERIQTLFTLPEPGRTPSTSSCDDTAAFLRTGSVTSESSRRDAFSRSSSEASPLRNGSWRSNGEDLTAWVEEADGGLRAAAWPRMSGGESARQAAAAAMDSWSFSVLDFSADDQTVLVAQAFAKMGLHESLRISGRALRRFILSVRARMSDNPYHNWAHVVDVVQTVYCLARDSGLAERLSPLRRLALLLGALCHDIEHPGVTAAFLLKSESNLAALYKKDPGLLEKHHSLRAFELMVRKDINLLRGLTGPDRRELCACVKELILATDMGRHGSFVASLQARLADIEAGVATSIPTEASDDGDGLLLEMQLLLKLADISNVSKPLHLAREWAVAVTDEFFAQGDLERLKGLDVTPMCDRLKQSRVGLQKGFLDFVAGPFVRSLARHFPGLEHVQAQLEVNRRSWDETDDDSLLATVRAVRADRAARAQDHLETDSAIPAMSKADQDPAVHSPSAADAVSANGQSATASSAAVSNSLGADASKDASAAMAKLAGPASPAVCKGGEASAACSAVNMDGTRGGTQPTAAHN